MLSYLVYVGFGWSFTAVAMRIQQPSGDPTITQNLVIPGNSMSLPGEPKLSNKKKLGVENKRKSLEETTRRSLESKPTRFLAALT